MHIQSYIVAGDYWVSNFNRLHEFIMNREVHALIYPDDKLEIACPLIAELD